MWVSVREHWAQQSNLLNIMCLATLALGFSLASLADNEKRLSWLRFLARVLQ